MVRNLDESTVRALKERAAKHGDSAEETLFLSVLVLGEIRRGIESIAQRDKATSSALEAWTIRLADAYEQRILPITREIANVCGRMNVPDPLPVIDLLLAATALVHGLTLATRNSKDVARTGVLVINPFLPPVTHGVVALFAD